MVPGPHTLTRRLTLHKLRAILLLVMLASQTGAAEDVLRIAVAANFRATLEQINTAYTQKTGQQILLSSAATGTLANQVLHGAPFDLFLAADKTTPEHLVSAGTGSFTRCYAVGSLALLGGNPDTLATAGLSVAIGNPATAPYGRAAMDVLARPEFAARRTLVRGNNVLQAYQFWYSGAVDLAIVARSLAPGAYPIPPQWHRPLSQHLVVLRQTAAARAYLQWLGSDTVRQMITNAGYLPCP